MKQMLLSYSAVYLNTVAARSVEERAPRTCKRGSVCRLQLFVPWPSATEKKEWSRGKTGLERKWSKTDGEDQPRNLVLGVGGIFR